jgi:hypothetical protein
MILVWDDAKSFQRHILDMDRFRRSHTGIEGIVKSFHDMPALLDIGPACHPGRPGVFTAVRGKPVVVPIWEMALPGGSEN